MNCAAGSVGRKVETREREKEKQNPKEQGKGPDQKM
jgi:hypothetical protein